MNRMHLKALLIGFAVITPLVYSGPQILSDFAIKDDLTIATDLAIKEAKCDRWYYVISTCNVTYDYRNEPQRVGSSLSYLVFGNWGGETAILVRSRSNPEWVGTTHGIEYKRQRLVTFGIFLVIALGYIIYTMANFMRGETSEEDTASMPALEPSTQPASATSTGLRTFGRRTARVAR